MTNTSKKRKIFAGLLAAVLILSFVLLLSPVGSVFAATTHTVTFVLNGGTRVGGGELVQTVNDGQIYVSLTVPTVSREGYTFGGWYLDAACSSTALGTVQNQGIFADTSIYAKWTPTNVTITYDANDGFISAGNATEIITAGTVYSALTTPTVTRTGYTFAGWYTSGGVAIGSMPQQPITADLTLLAHWTLDESGGDEGGETGTTFIITYNPNGGTIISGSGTQTVNEGIVYMALTTPTVARTGYTFAGWYTSGGVAIGSMPQQPISADQTLYAHWTVNTSGDEPTPTYQVIYNSNGGTISSGSGTQIVNLGTKYSALSYPTVIRTNYKFVAWYLDAACENSPVSNYASVGINSNVTLYAKWTVQSLLVTYEPNGGQIDSGNPTQTVAYNQPILTLTPPIVSREGYNFAGWVLENPESDYYIGSMQQMPITENTVIYAKWTPKAITVTFNANGGTFFGGSETLEIIPGTTYSALSIPGVSRSGYSFVAWYDEDGAAINATPQREIYDSVTFVAKWAELKYVDISNNVDSELKRLEFEYNNETGLYEAKIGLNDCGKTFVKIFCTTYNDNVYKNLNTTASLFNTYYDECNVTPFSMFDVSQRIGEIDTNMELRYEVENTGIAIKFTGIIFGATADVISDSYIKIVYGQSGSVEDPDNQNWFETNSSTILVVLFIVAALCLVLFIFTRVPLFFWIFLVGLALFVLMIIIL